MGPVSLVPSELGGDNFSYPLGLHLRARYPCIVCESGLVVIGPPDNRVPEFAASDPKLWDAGNCLVEVYPAFDFIWLLGVYLLSCVWVCLARI
jgi:hypothetical protein